MGTFCADFKELSGIVDAIEFPQGRKFPLTVIFYAQLMVCTHIEYMRIRSQSDS